jgi:hypothetical protein
LKGEAVKNGREVRSQGGNRSCFRDVTIILSVFQAIQDGLRYLTAYGQQMVLHRFVLDRAIGGSQNQ